MSKGPDTSVSECRDKKNNLIFEIESVANAIAGDGCVSGTKEQIRENIETIQKVISNGLHDTLYYPACGTDILRSLVAYDVLNIYCVDNNPQIVPQIIDKFTAANITLTIVEDTESKKIYTCVINDKPRTITICIDDARLVDKERDKLIGEHVDIYHLFLPTGADVPITVHEQYLKQKYGEEWYLHQYEEVANNDPEAPKPDPETGDYETVTQEITEGVQFDSFTFVRPGGFIVFGERPINAACKSTKGLLKLFDIEEYEITKRHPYTVMTSLYADEEELKSLSKIGYIYKKNRHLNESEFGVLKEALDLDATVAYIFMEIKRGGFNYIQHYQEQDNGAEGEDPTLVGDLIAYLRNVLSELDPIKEKMVALGYDTDQVEQYADNFYKYLIENVKDIQNNFRTLLEEYDSLYAQVEAGSITKQQMYKALGLKKNRFEQVVCDQWPIAPDYVRSQLRGDTGYDKKLREFIGVEFE